MSNLAKIFNICKKKTINDDEIKFLLGNPGITNSYGENLLHHLCKFGKANIELLDSMLSKGHTLDNYNSKTGYSPFHSTIAYNTKFHGELCNESENNRLDILEWILKNINVKKHFTQYVAVTNPDQVIIEGLINKHIWYNDSSIFDRKLKIIQTLVDNGIFNAGIPTIPLNCHLTFEDIKKIDQGKCLQIQWDFKEYPKNLEVIISAFRETKFDILDYYLQKNTCYPIFQDPCSIGATHGRIVKDILRGQLRIFNTGIDKLFTYISKDLEKELWNEVVSEYLHSGPYGDSNGHDTAPLVLHGLVRGAIDDFDIRLVKIMKYTFCNVLLYFFDPHTNRFFMPEKWHEKCNYVPDSYEYKTFKYVATTGKFMGKYIEEKSVCHFIEDFPNNSRIQDHIKKYDAINEIKEFTKEYCQRVHDFILYITNHLRVNKITCTPRQYAIKLLINNESITINEYVDWAKLQKYLATYDDNITPDNVIIKNNKII